MKRDCYVYPAILSYAKDGDFVSFLDLPKCITCWNNGAETLAVDLFSLEEDGEVFRPHFRLIA